MGQGMDRRTFLRQAGLGAGAGALILGGVPVGAGAQRRRGVPFARGGEFVQGVASGEPAPGGVTLWTRLGGHTADRKLRLEIASDPGFGRVLYERDVVARAAKDHTVEVRLQGKRFLRPGERYWYRFGAGDAASPVGRFKLARPADSREPVRIAFFSCQDYQAGYYGAHSTIAELDDVDLVVCLGDYIYERTFYEGPDERRDTLGANGDGEVQTLDEYRAKYRLYKGDADLQAMHAAHPFMAIWDDHEVEDNYAGELPGEATIDARVPFGERRLAGYRSFYEYMPFRRLRGLGYRLHRTVPLGRTVELFLTDQRQFRDDQPCGDDLFVPCLEAGDPGRTYLGREQREWLKDELVRSRATWKVIASQLMLMSLDEAPGVPINKDSWDGYADERREVLEHVRRNGVRDVTAITGDIHTFFAGEVGVSGRGPDSVATEFVGGSITALGIPEAISDTAGGALSPEGSALVTGNIRLVNPHIKYDEQSSRGYGILEASEDELLVTFRGVDAVRRSTEARTLRRFRVPRGSARVQVL
ncbi:MAG: alkaline phosphatase D family protein [Thermoleophilaceae bacterium]